MHDDIKRFSLTGCVGDSNIVREKEVLVRSLEDQMRESGFVPVLDMDPQFTLDFNETQEHYQFELTVYGVYVGEEKSWSNAGMMAGRTITRFIPPAR